MKQIDGYFLSFTPKEMELLKEVLQEEELTVDAGGIKMLLLRLLEDEEVFTDTSESNTAEDILARANEWMRNNPDQAGAVGSMMQGALGGLAKAAANKFKPQKKAR